MPTYISTYITGFEAIMPSVFSESLPGARIHNVSDGIFHYSSDLPYRRVRDLPFVNSSFLCISATDIQSKEERRDPVKTVKRLFEMSDVSSIMSSISRKQDRSFRIRISWQGDLIGIPKRIQHRIETSIIQKTGYKLDPLRSDLEFWFIIRRDGKAYYAMKEVVSQDKREKGSLSLDLAHLLCFLARPKESDIILDPFAGSGRIPFTAVKHFSHNKILASDFDVANTQTMKRTQRKIKKPVEIYNWDALHMTALSDESVNVVITDPPWGIYKKTQINIKKFYRMMLEELARVLVKHGILVILTNQKQVFEDAVSMFNQLSIDKTYHILVSGKKAGVFIVKKGD